MINKKPFMPPLHSFIPSLYGIILIITGLFLFLRFPHLSEFLIGTLILMISFIVCRLIFFLQNKNSVQNKNDFFPHPTFIILPTGKIKSSNTKAAELVFQAHGNFNDLLINHGLDAGAGYRLLNAKESTIEKTKDYFFKSFPLENGCIIVTRQDKSNIIETKPDTHLQNLLHTSPIELQQSLSQQNLLSELEALDLHKSIEDLEKNQGAIFEEFHEKTPIINTQNFLKKWIKNDHEMMNYFTKFGSSDSKRSLGIQDKTKKDTSFYGSKLETSSFKNGEPKEKQRLVDLFKEVLFHNYLQVPSASLKKNHDKTLSDSSNFKNPQNPLNSFEYLSSVLMHLPCPIAIINTLDHIVFCNNKFSNFFELTTPQGVHIRSLFPEGERPKFDSVDTETCIELILEKPREKILSLTILPFQNHGHKICYFNDVTHEKSLEQKFNQAQKMQAIGQLAGGIAHDFNNLLTAILGHAELLMNCFTPSDAVYSDLLHIRNNANRAGNLVRQLLAFSRRQTLKPQIIVLTDILPDLSRMLERLMSEKIKLITHYAPCLKPIKADITQLEQVIINLGVNARDAMENDGGTLSITTSNITPQQAKIQGHNIMPAAEYVKLSFSDTGHGMSNDIKSKIFEPFFTTKEQGKGTGLGLSTVYGIVKQSGGFIFVDSEIGKGSEFRIYFPVCYEKKIEEDISRDYINQEEELIIPKSPYQKTILIVEDEDSVRSFAVRALTLRGYKIFEADSGEAALEIFQNNSENINLILTDVMMPGLSGPEWIKRAKQFKESFSVIFMSGYTQDYFRDDQAFDSLGLDVEFLSKPFSLKALNEIVQKKL